MFHRWPAPDRSETASAAAWVYCTLREGSRVPPNQPATPNRSIRVPDPLWEEVLRIAQDQHTTATEIALRALRAYVKRYPAE